MLLPKFQTSNALVCAKGMLFTTTLPTPKCSPLLKPHLQFFCLNFSFNPHSSSTTSYLINYCGFSPEKAFKASVKLRLQNYQNPDSVLAFFRTHGFSDSQITKIIISYPRLLSCNPHKVLLPKLQFLLSKGASTSDVVLLVNSNPGFLVRSLHNLIIPQYEFIRGFLQSDKQTIACITRCSGSLSVSRLKVNIKLLLDNGVTHSNIGMLFRMWPRILSTNTLLKTVEELKQLGFNSSTSTFIVALLAKGSQSKTRWAEKIDTFKTWGWSQEHILRAFKRQPYCMLTSTDKINAVMSFLVNELGFNSLYFVKASEILLFSLEKRIIPRASVLQFLISKGLLEKDACIRRPLVITEDLFLEKFVKCFKEDSSHLLKLYEEKMNLAKSRKKAATECITS